MSTSTMGLTLAILIGLVAGLGVFTFGYGEGWSYFSSDPRACVNCHVMRSEYDAWQKSSHHAAARCVDCHLPHSPVRKLLAKADSGYRHSLAFTTGNFHEPIQIKPKSSRVLEETCMGCHEAIVSSIAHPGGDARSSIRCVRCHSGVGHAQ